jgi:hypothetical protein
MAFRDNNAALNLSPTDSFKVGRSDVDAGSVIEKDVLLPWPSNPLASWVYYDCTVGVMLDSGIVVHNRLPQVDNLPDTLAGCIVSDPNLDNIVGPGVNLKSLDQYEDIVQRMGHSRYWFRIWGQALRVAKQVPIPRIKTIGGVPAIPYDKNPQWAFNRIFPGGNYSGNILWHAGWSLWYTTSVPPRSNDIPAVDAAAHIGAASRGPSEAGISAPFSQRDDDAVPVGPGSILGGGRGGSARGPKQL